MKASGEREAHDTPCKGKCNIFGEDCKTCFRTAEEVLNWNLLSIEDKVKIKALIKERVKQNGIRK